MLSASLYVTSHWGDPVVDVVHDMDTVRPFPAREDGRNVVGTAASAPERHTSTSDDPSGGSAG